MNKLFQRLCFIALVFIASFSLTGKAEIISRDNIVLEYVSLDTGQIQIKQVKNNNAKRIDLFVDGKSFTINGESSYRFPGDGVTAGKTVEYKSSTNGGHIWKFKAPATKKTEQSAAATIETPQESNSNVAKEVNSHINVTQEIKEDNRKDKKDKNNSKKNVKTSISELIKNDPYYGEEATQNFINKADSLARGITNSKNPSQYIIDNDVNQFLSVAETEISDHKSSLPIFAEELIMESNIGSSSEGMLMNSVVETLGNQLMKRQRACETLISTVNLSELANETKFGTKEDILNYSIIGGLVLIFIIIVLWLAFRKNKKTKPSKQTKTAPSVATTPVDKDNPGIVVRRRTTSILKKQNIDDVKDNPAYLKINSSEFVKDSAVRNIYIKNSCIKEVYGLYAEDLRNSANPKEDGCMVLGRWVKVDDSQTYDVSLEDVIFPGDDAVFKEYELNFGGKIKMRVADTLRRLRKDTNLQYDLVCWIHSHPGLGVFFSNSDSNVQDQLKHIQHPNFLIAFVVDILTSDQELGIFSYRKDGTLNTKNDLKKLFSLEDWYKWSIESEKKSFNSENYYDVLKGAQEKLPNCKGIELDNSSIIDISQLVIEQETGVIGWVIGSKMEIRNGTEFVVKSIQKKSEKPNSGIIGTLVSMTNLSLPTLQRIINEQLTELDFVLVYSTKSSTITAIPIENGEPMADTRYYNEVNLEDLKIWTRRKR